MPDLAEAIKRQEFEYLYEWQHHPIEGMIPSLGLICATPVYIIYEVCRTSSYNEGLSFNRPEDQLLDMSVRYPAENIDDLGWIFLNSVGNVMTLGCLNSILDCVNECNKAQDKD